MKTLNNINDFKKKLINCSNEFSNSYLNTEIGKSNYNNNLTYSNLMNNFKEIKTLEISNNEKIRDEILINILNKIFFFFNKDKNITITLKNPFYKKRIAYFDRNIGQILNSMIEILIKNYKNKKIQNKKIINKNKYGTNMTKNNKSNLIIIDKNDFINEMLYIYNHYLSDDCKKMIISHKNDIYKVIQDNIIDKSFYPMSKINNYRINYISPKSNQKKILE